LKRGQDRQRDGARPRLKRQHRLPPRRHHLTGLHTKAISSVAFSPDGNLLALASGDQTASLLDARTGERRLHLKGLHTDYINSVAFSPDGNLLALASDDNTASLLDITTGERRLHLKGLHTGYIYSVAFAPETRGCSRSLAAAPAEDVPPSRAEVQRQLRDLAGAWRHACAYPLQQLPLLACPTPTTPAELR
jgi:hypothetical protein